MVHLTARLALFNWKGILQKKLIDVYKMYDLQTHFPLNVTRNAVSPVVQYTPLAKNFTKGYPSVVTHVLYHLSDISCSVIPVNSMSFIWNDNMREKREGNANAT